MSSIELKNNSVLADLPDENIIIHDPDLICEKNSFNLERTQAFIQKLTLKTFNYEKVYLALRKILKKNWDEFYMKK